MKRALVTGITGQEGIYLSELLLGKGYSVCGLIGGNPKVDLIRATVPDMTLLTGDLTDLSSLVNAVNAARPDEAFAQVGIADWEPLVKVDPALVRPADPSILVGDAGKARDRLQWAPTVGFEEIIGRMVDADLAELGRDG